MENRKYTENISVWLRRFPGRILILPNAFVKLHIQRKMKWGKEKKKELFSFQFQ